MRFSRTATVISLFALCIFTPLAAGQRHLHSAPAYTQYRATLKALPGAQNTKGVKITPTLFIYNETYGLGWLVVSSSANGGPMNLVNGTIFTPNAMDMSGALGLAGNVLGFGFRSTMQGADVPVTGSFKTSWVGRMGSPMWHISEWLSAQFVPCS